MFRISYGLGCFEGIEAFGIGLLPSTCQRRVCRTREIGYSGLGGRGGGGMMTTLVLRHPEQYLHKSRFTRYLQFFRDGGLTKAAFR